MKKHILVLFVALLSIATFAQTEKTSENKVAIKGYDPVAYFQEVKAIKGDKSISAIQSGKTYYFASENNKASFLKNPTAYEPQYGGYCAYGMSEGYEAPIQPEAFAIVDKKLYLNYNIRIRTDWQKQQKDRIAKGDVNWAESKK